MATTEPTDAPHHKLNMGLAARLSRAGIVAGPNLGHGAGLVPGDRVIGFRLFERKDAEKADQDERVPGAKLGKPAMGYDGWFDDWLKEVDRAHAVVCKHFDLTEQALFVHEETGQLVLHVFRGKREESCRWIQGIGWVGW